MPVLKLEEVTDIETAILYVMGKIGYVQKKKSAGLNYTFADERALIQGIRPHMLDAGITVHVTGITSQVSRQYESKSGTGMTNASATYEVTFTHAKSKTQRKTYVMGEGADTGDKAWNKAGTDALKYALRQVFLIETGDDPDETKHERATDAAVAATKLAQARLQADRAISQTPIPVPGGTTSLLHTKNELSNLAQEMGFGKAALGPIFSQSGIELPLPDRDIPQQVWDKALAALKNAQTSLGAGAQ